MNLFQELSTYIESMTLDVTLLLFSSLEPQSWMYYKNEVVLFYWSHWRSLTFFSDVGNISHECVPPIEYSCLIHHNKSYSYALLMSRNWIVNVSWWFSTSIWLIMSESILFTSWFDSDLLGMSITDVVHSPHGSALRCLLNIREKKRLPSGRTLEIVKYLGSWMRCGHRGLSDLSDMCQECLIPSQYKYQIEGGRHGQVCSAFMDNKKLELDFCACQEFSRLATASDHFIRNE